jgi:hypothetical protein
MKSSKLLYTFILDIRYRIELGGFLHECYVFTFDSYVFPGAWEYKPMHTAFKIVIIDHKSNWKLKC